MFEEQPEQLIGAEPLGHRDDRQAALQHRSTGGVPVPHVREDGDHTGPRGDRIG